MKTTKVRMKTVSNTSFKGVHLHTNTNKYEARFTYGGVQHYIGSYGSLPEAVTARRNYILGLI